MSNGDPRDTPPSRPGAHPTKFWIVLDSELPVTAWQVMMTGRFTSSAWGAAVSDPVALVQYVHGRGNYVPFVENPCWDLRTAGLSMYMQAVRTNYIVEYEAERVRRLVDGTLPSRLSAVFAFGRKKDADKAARAENRARRDSPARLPVEVRQFELLPHELNRVHVVNMHIISVMRRALRVATWSQAETEANFRHYWTSRGNLAFDLPSPDPKRRQLVESGVMWEYLIEGQLQLVDARPRSTSAQERDAT